MSSPSSFGLDPSMVSRSALVSSFERKEALVFVDSANSFPDWPSLDRDDGKTKKVQFNAKLGVEKTAKERGVVTMVGTNSNAGENNIVGAAIDTSVADKKIVKVPLIKKAIAQKKVARNEVESMGGASSAANNPATVIAANNKEQIKLSNSEPFNILSKAESLLQEVKQITHSSSKPDNRDHSSPISIASFPVSVSESRMNNTYSNNDNSTKNFNNISFPPLETSTSKARLREDSAQIDWLLNGVSDVYDDDYENIMSDEVIEDILKDGGKPPTSLLFPSYYAASQVIMDKLLSIKYLTIHFKHLIIYSIKYGIRRDCTHFLIHLPIGCVRKPNEPASIMVPLVELDMDRSLVEDKKAKATGNMYKDYYVGGRDLNHTVTVPLELTDQVIKEWINDTTSGSVKPRGSIKIELCSYIISPKYSVTSRTNYKADPSVFASVDIPLAGILSSKLLDVLVTADLDIDESNNINVINRMKNMPYARAIQEKPLHSKLGTLNCRVTLHENQLEKNSSLPMPPSQLFVPLDPVPYDALTSAMNYVPVEANKIPTSMDKLVGYVGIVVYNLKLSEPLMSFLPSTNATNCTISFNYKLSKILRDEIATAASRLNSQVYDVNHGKMHLIDDLRSWKPPVIEVWVHWQDNNINCNRIIGVVKVPSNIIHGNLTSAILASLDSKSVLGSVFLTVLIDENKEKIALGIQNSIRTYSIQHPAEYEFVVGVSSESNDGNAEHVTALSSATNEAKTVMSSRGPNERDEIDIEVSHDDGYVVVNHSTNTSLYSRPNLDESQEVSDYQFKNSVSYVNEVVDDLVSAATDIDISKSKVYVLDITNEAVSAHVTGANRMSIESVISRDSLNDGSPHLSVQVPVNNAVSLSVASDDMDALLQLLNDKGVDNAPVANYDISSNKSVHRPSMVSVIDIMIDNTSTQLAAVMNTSSSYALGYYACIQSTADKVFAQSWWDSEFEYLNGRSQCKYSDITDSSSDVIVSVFECDVDGNLPANAKVVATGKLSGDNIRSIMQSIGSTEVVQVPLRAVDADILLRDVTLNLQLSHRLEPLPVASNLWSNMDSAAVSGSPNSTSLVEEESILAAYPTASIEPTRNDNGRAELSDELGLSVTLQRVNIDDVSKYITTSTSNKLICSCKVSYSNVVGATATSFLTDPSPLQSSVTIDQKQEMWLRVPQRNQTNSSVTSLSGKDTAIVNPVLVGFKDTALVVSFYVNTLTSAVGCATVDLSTLAIGMPFISGWYHIVDATGSIGQLKITVTQVSHDNMRTSYDNELIESVINQDMDSEAVRTSIGYNTLRQQLKGLEDFNSRLASKASEVVVDEASDASHSLQHIIKQNDENYDSDEFELETITPRTSLVAQPTTTESSSESDSTLHSTQSPILHPSYDDNLNESFTSSYSKSKSPIVVARSDNYLLNILPHGTMLSDNSNSSASSGYPVAQTSSVNDDVNLCDNSSDYSDSTMYDDITETKDDALAGGAKSPFDYSISSDVEYDFDFNNNDDIDDKEQVSTSQSISEASSVIALDKYDRRYSDMDYYAIMDDSSGSGSVSQGENGAEIGLINYLAIDVDKDGLPPSLSANIIAMIEQQSVTESNVSSPMSSSLSPANFFVDGDGLPPSLSANIIQQNESTVSSNFVVEEVDGLPASLSANIIAKYEQQNESIMSSNFAEEEEDISMPPSPLPSTKQNESAVSLNIDTLSGLRSAISTDTSSHNEENASPTTVKIRRILHEELDKALIDKGVSVCETAPVEAPVIVVDTRSVVTIEPSLTLPEKKVVPSGHTGSTSKSNDLSARIARAVSSINMQQAKVTTKLPGKQRVFIDQETERVSKIMLGASRSGNKNK